MRQYRQQGAVEDGNLPNVFMTITVAEWKFPLPWGMLGRYGGCEARLGFRGGREDGGRRCRGSPLLLSTDETRFAAGLRRSPAVEPLLRQERLGLLELN